MADIVKLNGTGSAGSSASVTARVKHSFSRQHMFDAEIFGAEARRIENAGASGGQDELNRHRAYVTAAILSAVAFLESSVNEFYHEAESRDHTALPLSEHVLALLTELWSEIEESGVLQKHQVALLVAEAERFDPGASPFQETEALVKLRNALVHYKPEWDDEQGKHHKLQLRLSGKFLPNPLVPPASLWFPHLCLGAGCAEWAVRTAGAFSDAFCDRLGIPRRHM